VLTFRGFAAVAAIYEKILSGRQGFRNPLGFQRKANELLRETAVGGSVFHSVISNIPLNFLFRFLFCHFMLSFDAK